MNPQLNHDPNGVSLTMLIRLAQSDPRDDTLAMNAIVRRFDRLAHRLANGVQAADYHLRHDLANAARMGLVRAVRRHNGTLGFPAFAEIHMRGALLREYKRWMVPETPDLEVVEREQDKVDDHTSEVLDGIAPWGDGKIASVIDNLDPLQRALVEMRYIDDAPIKEIGEVTGTSGPAVSQRLGTIHRAVARSVAA